MLPELVYSKLLLYQINSILIFYPPIIYKQIFRDSETCRLL